MLKINKKGWDVKQESSFGAYTKRKRKIYKLDKEN